MKRKTPSEPAADTPAPAALLERAAEFYRGELTERDRGQYLRLHI